MWDWAWSRLHQLFGQDIQPPPNAPDTITKPSVWHTSPEGQNFIKGFEGLRLTAYKPLRGDVWTIGYGYTGPDVHEGLVWSKAQADIAFTHRLNTEFEPAVNRVCNGVPTTQGQFDAMVSLAYNIGAQGFSVSQVAKFHRQSDYLLCAKAFENYDHFHGVELDALKNRRLREADVYRNASPK